MAAVRVPGMPRIISTTWMLPLAAVTPSTAPWPNPNTVSLPIELITEPRANWIPDAEGHSRDTHRCLGFIDGIIIVLWYIDNILLGWYNPDIIALHGNLLLGSIDQVSSGPGLGSKLLHRLHDIGGLLRECGAQDMGPI